MTSSVSTLTIAVLMLVATALAHSAEHPTQPGKSWTFDEAKAELDLNPKDPYLQYVVLQLARRENKADALISQIEASQLANRWQQSAERRSQADLFSIFSGALAVQESLQLESMRPQNDPKAKIEDPSVILSSLSGPTIKSHPWKKMLDSRKPELSKLCRCVPETYYLVEFQSLNKLIDAMEIKDLWGTHLLNQATQDARTQRVGERLKAQLAIETNPLLRPFYDLVVEEVALTGSDLFVNEGSDVTVLFQLRQPEIFKARMAGFLNNAEKAYPDAQRTPGSYMDVPYELLSTPDRAVHVISAYPSPNLHIRSNSLTAFQNIIDTIKGKDANGKDVQRLGETDEFAYIRTLMPRGAKEEDGFVYLSDPFIRRQIGPQTKLVERRRILCYNHLRMAGHAALLYRTEFGKAPVSLPALTEAKCLPGEFNRGALCCPDGGTYSLKSDGLSAICSCHGHANLLTPCCELPLSKVTKSEAEQYDEFLKDYNQYWRTYFDPIALRIQLTPQHYRAETIVLPLIDNSVYSQLAQALGGKPEALDSMPVPKRNILTVALKVNKEALLKADNTFLNVFQGIVIAETSQKLDAHEFLEKGVGNQVALNIYDAPPTFDLNTAQLIGESIATFNGNRIGQNELALSYFIASVNAPVYASFSVQDAKIVDKFLETLDAQIAEMARRPATGWFPTGHDFYTYTLKQGQIVRSHGISIGPVKWRTFWARIGNHLYVASKPFILEDIVAAESTPAAGPAVDASTDAHGLLRVRAMNWNQALPDFRLGWAENNRKACLNNLSPLSNIARANIDGQNVWRLADMFYGTHFFCPEGGHYELTADGKTVNCSVHGSVLSPRQALTPDENGAMGKLMSTFQGMTAAVTFTDEGLRAVVTVDRN